MMPNSTTQANLILHAVSQLNKRTNIVQFHSHEVPKVGKFAELVSRPGIAMVCGRGK